MSRPLAPRHARDESCSALVGSGAGGVLVSDTRLAHSHMSPRALRDAMFSPGLGQATGTGLGVGVQHPRAHALVSSSSFGSGPRSASNSPRQTLAALRARLAGPSMENNIERDDEDDEDDGDVLRRRDAPSRLAQLVALAAPLARPPPARAFDPRRLRTEAEPRVPRATEAAAHKPGGGQVKIFSRKLDLSHVGSRIAADLASAPAPPPAHLSRAPHEQVHIFSERTRDVRARWDAAALPSVPTAQSAAVHNKPAAGAGGGGGGLSIAAPPVSVVRSQKLQWDAVATVPSASDAARYKPRESSVAIPRLRVDFSSRAHPRVAQTSRDARAYRPHGGDVDVFLWRKNDEESVAARARAAKAALSEDEKLEQLFGSPVAALAVTEEADAAEDGDTTAAIQQAGDKPSPAAAAQQLSTQQTVRQATELAAAYTTRKRRERLLQMD